MAKVVTFLGTRSDTIKLSPLIPLLARNFQHVLVHSGQHDAREMGGALCQELGLPAPDVELRAGSHSDARQIAQMMLGLEQVLLEQRPAALVVLGGANTALAGALTGAKLGVRVAHLEAGLRTFNLHAPEETDRVVIDRMSHWLFAPDAAARAHLVAEGLDAHTIHVVGSTTIDACRQWAASAGGRGTLARLKVDPHQYLVLTLHRVENTVPDTLREIVSAVNALGKLWPIVFPIHPRTLRALPGERPFADSVKVIPPVSYLDMLNLVRNARALLTDSIGLQEEAAVLGIPALIMRNETEWQRPVEAGVSILVGNTYRSLMDRAWPTLALDTALSEMRRKALDLPGGAALRVAQCLARDLAAPNLESPVAASDPGSTSERLS